MNYCENCGELLKDDQAFCPNCGTPNPNYKAPEPEKAPEPAAPEPAPEPEKAAQAPAQPAAPVKKKSAGKTVAIVLGIVALALVLVIGGLLAAYFIPYSLANKAVDAGDTEKADRLLYVKPVTKLHDPEIVAYVEAARLFEGGNYPEAAEAFKAIKDYKDSDSRSYEASLLLAEEKIADGKTREAIGVYEALIKDGRDCKGKLDEAKYLLALETLDSGDFEKAVEMLTALKDTGYPYAGDTLDEAWFDRALELAEEGKYPEAKDILARLKNEGYDGADEALNEVIYAQAESILEKGDKLSALALFEKLANEEYYDSADRAVELLTDLARESAQAKKIKETADLIERIESLDPDAAEQVDLEVREMFAALTEEGSTAFVHYWRDRIDMGDDEAYDYFVFSVHNIFSGDMRRAEYAPFPGESGFYPDEQFPEYFSDIDDLYYALLDTAFADAREDQCYDVLRLMGTWTGSGYSFKLYEDDGYYTISYNLPWFDFGDFYYIFDHEIRLVDFSTGEERSLFRLTFISDTEIEIYCFKDGSTHTLYKN